VYSKISIATLVVSMVACKPAATQILLYVESDLPRETISEFSIDVTSGGEEQSAHHRWPRQNTPQSLGIAPPNGEVDAPIELVIASHGTTQVEARRSIAGFIEHETVKLYVCLFARCLTNSAECNRTYDDLETIDQDADERSFTTDCAPKAIAGDGGLPEDVEEPQPDSGEPQDLGEGAELPKPPPPPPWARRIGGAGMEIMGDVLFDRAGNVIVAGGFTGQIDFNMEPVPYDSQGKQNGFIASYSPAGDPLWFVHLAPAESRVWALALGPNDELYAAATAFDDITVLGEPIDVPAPKMDQSGELLVLHLNIAGAQVSYINSLAAGGEGAQSGRGIAVDGSGDVHVGGNYTEGFNICSDGAAEDPAGQDVFWAKLDPTLRTCRWVRRFASSADDDLEDLKVSPYSRVVAIAGEMRQTFDVADLPRWSRIGQEDIFLATFDGQDGTFAAHRIGTPGVDEDPRIAFDPDGHLHVVARYISDDRIHVDTSSRALDGEAVLDVLMTAPPNIFTTSATSGDVLAAGVAVLPSSRETVIGWNYAQVSGLDIMLAVVGGDRRIRSAWSFGGGEDDNLVRVAASDSLIAAVGTFSSSISFPGAQGFSSAGARDNFVYVVPIPEP
jgi:hypothetical protein